MWGNFSSNKRERLVNEHGMDYRLRSPSQTQANQVQLMVIIFLTFAKVSKAVAYFPLILGYWIRLGAFLDNCIKTISWQLKMKKSSPYRLMPWQKCPNEKRFLQRVDYNTFVSGLHNHHPGQGYRVCALCCDVPCRIRGRSLEHLQNFLCAVKVVRPSLAIIKELVQNHEV